MRLLSRPLGVVRIRWGICRRGWCGCGVIAQGHGRVAAEVIDGPRVENSRIRRHNTPPPTLNYEEPIPPLIEDAEARPVWPSRCTPLESSWPPHPATPQHCPRSSRAKVRRPSQGRRTWSARGTHVTPQWTHSPPRALTSRRHGHTCRHGHSRHASTDALAATGTHVTPQRTHSPPRALTSRPNGHTRHHGHSRHASTGTLAATGTHVTPQRTHSPPRAHPLYWIVTDTSCVCPLRSIVMVTVSPAR